MIGLKVTGKIYRQIFTQATMSLSKSGQQLEIMGNRWDGRPSSQPDPKIPDHRDLDSSRSTVDQSPDHIDHPELLGRKRRSFAAWTIELHSDNQLRVEGTLECGRRARTKPIVRRIDASQVLSQSNYIYHLVGNISDSQYELPEFIRHGFHAGFPEDWETVVGIWKSLVASECHAAVRPSPMSEGLIARKNLNFASDKPMENDDRSEYARSVTRKQSESHSTDENHKSQGPQGFKTMGESRRLIAWTPFILPHAAVDYCLAFRGTLLNSMGFPVNKNHRTDAVRRRISARIIETVNREIYELNGDLNNTKRDVPKELVTWCRHGCPKDIDLFCEKWRILRSNENTYPNILVHGEKRIGQNHERVVAIPSHYDTLATIDNCRINWESNMRLGGNNKRKKISTELNDSCSVIDNNIVDDTSCGEQPATEFTDNSPVRRRPKMRRKILTDLPITFRGDEDVAEMGHTTSIGRLSRENEKQRSSTQQAPTLSYTYRKQSPDIECILSDGV